VGCALSQPEIRAHPAAGDSREHDVLSLAADEACADHALHRLAVAALVDLVEGRQR